MRLSLPQDAKTGLKGAGLWAAVEIGIRGGLTTVVGLALLLSGVLPEQALTRGPFLGVSFAITLFLALIVLSRIFRQRVAREGLGLDDLGYRFGYGRLIAGLAVGILLFGVVFWGTSEIDIALFPEGLEMERVLARLVVEGGPIVIVSLILGNGVLAPLVEEYAWRGYIQYRLTRGWGASTGFAITALLFALKHVVVDLSFGRITTLLVFAYAIGMVRQRLGTAASTASHMAANLIASVYAITRALTGQI
ncbi:MAG: lysostaphin resistance A-like protein [bacterium]